MDTWTLGNSIQMFTGFAVVIGLGLVIWELQQAREITRFEQARAGSAGYAQRVQAQMGENVAGPVAKACDEPDRLTTEEMFVLDRYYLDVLNNLRETLYASKVSEDLTVDEWQQWATDSFSRVLPLSMAVGGSR